MVGWGWVTSFNQRLNSCSKEYLQCTHLTSKKPIRSNGFNMVHHLNKIEKFCSIACTGKKTNVNLSDSDAVSCKNICMYLTKDFSFLSYYSFHTTSSLAEHIVSILISLYSSAKCLDSIGWCGDASSYLWQTDQKYTPGSTLTKEHCMLRTLYSVFITGYLVVPYHPFKHRMD